MTIQAAGRIFKIFETKKISETFSKREFVVELEGGGNKYPQMVLFQVTQDRCPILDISGVGDLVTLDINLKGREWTSPQGDVKYFNTLEVWRMTLNQKSSEGETGSAPTPGGEPAPDADIPF